RLRDPKANRAPLVPRDALGHVHELVHQTGNEEYEEEVGIACEKGVWREMQDFVDEEVGRTLESEAEVLVPEYASSGQFYVRINGLRWEVGIHDS
ncbi:MAG: hypothetical protein Q9187_005937, partial [Circinaria calcarea]